MRGNARELAEIDQLTGEAYRGGMKRRHDRPRADFHGEVSGLARSLKETSTAPARASASRTRASHSARSSTSRSAPKEVRAWDGAYPGWHISSVVPSSRASTAEASRSGVQQGRRSASPRKWSVVRT